jgi:hypothetical protein
MCHGNIQAGHIVSEVNEHVLMCSSVQGGNTALTLAFCGHHYEVVAQLLNAAAAMVGDVALSI